MVSKNNNNNTDDNIPNPRGKKKRDPVSSQILREMARLKHIKNDITIKISYLETLLHHHRTNNSSITDPPFPFVSRELPHLSQHILIKIPRAAGSGSKQPRRTAKSEGPQLKINHGRGIRKRQKKKADKLCQLLKSLELTDQQNDQQEQVASQNMKGSQIKIDHDMKLEGSPHKVDDKKHQSNFIGDNFFLF